MSLEAFVWAAKLPMDACGGTEYRVLILLANHAHHDGRNAFRSTESLAAELNTSKRTVQRAIKNLRAAALIAPGNQELVEHIRPDRRPTVYDLNLRYGVEYTAPAFIDGVTTTVTPHGVTNLARGDNPVHNGVTTGVAHRTVIEPINSSTRDNQTARVTPSRCSGRRDGKHVALPSGYCNGCGKTMRVEVNA